MPIETELYDILGVNPNASDSDIKKAYRKKALEHHPDRGGDAEIFKKINGAYEILSDPDKKQMYDKYGKDGLKNSGQIPDDILSSMFGNIFGNFGNFGGIFDTFQNVRNTIRKTKPMVHHHNVTLEDLCTRKIVKLRLKRKRVCPCVETNTKQCEHCDGKGRCIMMRQIGPGMIQQMITECNHCQGRGKIITSCENCVNGIRELPKTFSLHLTPDLEDKYKYVFSNEGHQDIGYEPGDFMVILRYKKHNVFTVDNGHLKHTVNISLKDALCGNNVKLKHPSGESIEKYFQGVISPYKTQCIQGKGMTHEKNMILSFHIEYPKKIDDNHVKILRKIL